MSEVQNVRLSSRSLSDLSDAEWLWALTDGRGSADFLAILPSLPDEHVQRRFVGRAGREAFQQAISAFKRFVAGARDLGLELNPQSTLLDFGCGWGRLSQVALRHFAPRNIYSADVQEDALDLCRATGLPTNLVLVPMSPPSRLGNSSIDLVIAFSVFSHLSEAVHMAWLKEFHRILRPGGVVALTTRPRGFLRFVESLRNQAHLPPHASGLEDLVWNHAEPLEAYDSGKFVYGNYRAHGVLGGEYGEALISAEYAERNWIPLFERVKFMQSDAEVDQSILFARKGIA